MAGSPEKGVKDAGIEPRAISVNHLTTKTLARMLHVKNHYAPIALGNLCVYGMGSGTYK